MDLLIDYLANHPAHQRKVATWHHAAWGHLNMPARGVGQRCREFADQPAHEALNTTWLALLDGQPVASVSLLADDLDVRPELSPWLASLYVAPAWRRRGLGSRMIDRALDAAARLGWPRVYLFTADQVEYYRARGWQDLGREDCHGESVTLMMRQLASAVAAGPGASGG